MFRLLLLIIAVAAVAGYFTKPEEPAMREAADAVLRDPGNISEGLESIGASIAGERAYDNYFVASRYRIVLDDDPVVECWGAFTQIQCNRSEDAPAS